MNPSSSLDAREAAVTKIDKKKYCLSSSSSSSSYWVSLLSWNSLEFKLDSFGFPTKISLFATYFFWRGEGEDVSVCETPSSTGRRECTYQKKIGVDK